MEKVDVFVWVAGEDGAGASLAVRSLKAKMKCAVGQWFLLGVKSEKLDRLGYDLGMHTVPRPSDLGGLGALAAGHGDAPLVLFWSGEAVLAAEWSPWQGGQPRLWENCPAAFWRRSDLQAADAWPGAASTWPELQRASPLPVVPLPGSQVKVLEAPEFEKAAHGSSWPFGPSVVILEKTASRR